MKSNKKVGFVEKVARGVTGMTAEQRVEHRKKQALQRKADSNAKQIAKQVERAEYRKEQVRQAGSIGRAKAQFVAKQQRESIGKPKTLVDLGSWGKPQEGFNPFNFEQQMIGNPVSKSKVKAKMKKKKPVPSVDDLLKGMPN